MNLEARIAPSAVPLESLGAARVRRSDVSGFGVFADGDTGQAHVMAHQLLDQGRHELGHRWLGHWLAARDGQGSDWTHLQFHMAIFELALGQWDAAFARFEGHILPVAEFTEDALTDAPAMLWRLRLSAGRPVVLPWEPVRRTAARVLSRPSDLYVALHCILALAGACDIHTLDHWIAARSYASNCDDQQLLVRVASGLRAFAMADYRLAAAHLVENASRVSELGGSRAQNELFQTISDLSWRLADDAMGEAA
jgi:hypothetical protein